MSDEELPVVFTREELAYRMRRMGLTVSDIAQELQTESSAIVKLIKTQLEQDESYHSDEERKTLLDMENARLDYYLTKLWPAIEHGDPKSIVAALAVTDKRIKLNRMDIPSSTDRAAVLVISGESAEYVRQLKELADGA